ncbi:hypothetical protein [Leptospira noguchii]|uniref:Uncharacterized protein n=1 Tax=Leptospira noguchii TaxID=28182 RepID=M6VD65_9LEPT|nr:hypothetical protein [Leptospira noguchii]EMO54825.1 hypothetical protein LEP1GSC172_4313 [Leptospira noguchii]
MIKTNIKDDQISVFVDYNTEFIEKAKNLNGKWNPIEKSWSFNLKDHEEVKNVLRNIYGEDGESLTEFVNIKILTKENITSYDKGGITLKGREIARAYNKDTVKLGKTVKMISGEIDSGGTSNKVSTIIKENSIFLIEDFPKLLLDQIDDKFELLEIIPSEEKFRYLSKADLLSEKERLLKRLEALEKLIEKTK